LNVVVADPAGTVTIAGTVAAARLLLTETATPPDGAGPLRVIVPTELTPPTKLDGFSFRLVSVIDKTVSDAVTDPDPAEAVIVAVC